MSSRIRALLIGLLVLGAAAGRCGWAAAEAPFYANTFQKRPSAAAMAAIGRTLVFDTALSASGRVSCEDCHDPKRAFATPDAAPVRIVAPPTPEKIGRLCHGLTMDGRQLKPAKVSVVQGQELRFILKEGRNRQIRRMCELVGLHVMDLVRIRIGSLRLGDLAEGRWRILTPDERAALIAG